MNTTKLVQRACAIGVAIVGLAAPSLAGTLYTSPAETGQGAIPELMYCSVVNVSPGPITVTLDGMNYKGDVVGTTGDVVLDPNATRLQGFWGGAVYCRFSVSASAKKVVAGAFYSRNSDKKLVSFVPAQ